MISFRYHIVTIVAVFVALGAGILLGGTFFDTVLANQLQQQVRAQGAKLDRAESQVADLESQLASIQQLGSILPADHRGEPAHRRSHGAGDGAGCRPRGAEGRSPGTGAGRGEQ